MIDTLIQDNPTGVRSIDVPFQRLRPLLDQGENAGIEQAFLLQETALAESVSDLTTNTSVSLADYYRIQNRLAVLIGDETCHLSERQLIQGSTDFVLRHVGECTSLQQAMRVISESYNLLHGGAYNRVESSGAHIDYVIDDRNFPYTFEAGSDEVYFAMESTLIFLHCMLMTICPQNAEGALTALSLRRPRRDSNCDHLSYWQVPIKFDQSVYTIRFKAEHVTKAMPRPATTRLSARAVYETIQSAVERSTSNAKTMQALVEEHFHQGIYEQHEIAVELNISVATLRRRLTEEGVSFRDLRESILNRQAQILLQEGRSVIEVAEQLGFAEFRSFVRAFKNWNGVTPTAFVTEVTAQRD
ncbi:MAG: AraC family transcriptional regulator [Aquisalinus sp.]|nr:AraC family transcriptional regulator [Aquisalinus sp.]